MDIFERVYFKNSYYIIVDRLGLVINFTGFLHGYKDWGGLSGTRKTCNKDIRVKSIDISL